MTFAYHKRYTREISFFSLPELESAPLDLVLRDLGPPLIGKVERRDGAPLEPGLPEYLVELADYSFGFRYEIWDVELIDFGECKICFAAYPPSSLSPDSNCECISVLYHRPPQADIDPKVPSSTGAGLSTSAHCSS